MHADFTGKEDQPYIVFCQDPSGVLPLIAYFPTRKGASDAALGIPPDMEAGFIKVSSMDQITAAVKQFELKRYKGAI